ncbi:MAG TPA: alanine racemase [Acetobacteraceae bacterium]|jgi:D-serine deaminase-like pyridoxal phosphate-dependent protein|nr:alanine racemase [Acetobacteraceae bacterium]
MKLVDLPTPCLVLDRGILARNIATMGNAVSRHGVALRPHMKTAKSIDVARMVFGGEVGSITVSTLAEAEYFAGHGVRDMLYAACITPRKLDRVAEINARGARVIVVTDDAGVAAAIAGHPARPDALIEIDTGEGRSGIAPDEPALLEIAARLGSGLAGVMTHAGHSYSGRSIDDMRRFAAAERAGAVRAAARLRAAGFPCRIVSAGSSPTALHGTDFAGVTEVRAGVYMFGDLFQAEIGTHGLDDIAMTVLASVIGRRPAEGRIVIDAGGLALSKDRSTEAVPVDYGFGMVLDAQGKPSFGRAVVARAYQEHGVVTFEPGRMPELSIGGRVRVAPNHTCMTAAAHERYYVVDGGDDVVAVWDRVNGW